MWSLMTQEHKTFSVWSSAVSPAWFTPIDDFFTSSTILSGGTHNAPEASEEIFGKWRVEGKSFAIIVTP